MGSCANFFNMRAFMDYENQFLVAQINLLNQSKSRNEGVVTGLITC